jgi:hypothetical protein
MARVVESYVARKRFTVGDRIVEAGDPVPEAQEWRRPQAWIDSGYIAAVFVDADEFAANREASREARDEIAQGRVLYDSASDDPEVDVDALRDGYASLNVGDLRALAKEQGLTGFSKLRKDALLDLLVS